MNLTDSRPITSAVARLAERMTDMDLASALAAAESEGTPAGDYAAAAYRAEQESRKVAR